MPQRRFPDPLYATPDGIVALGERLDPDTLREAYRRGIFPWPVDGLPLPWFCPPERGVLEFGALHIPRRLQRIRQQEPFRLTLDQAFDAVIEQCAARHQPTWITPPMLRAYKTLHRAGDAHSAEAWDGDQLVGGVYGVDAGGAFSCESMFYLRPNASKLALLHLIDHLRSRGLDWIDIQMVTPHLEVLGARAIQREDFLERLARTQVRGLSLFG